MLIVDEKTLIKFYSNIEDIDNEHWIWIGSRDKDEYGWIYTNGKQWKAHRFSYSVFIGDIEENLLVCHKCDITSCVKPDHLFQGTIQDNNRDTVLKGRHNSGSKEGKVASRESHGRTHLTEEDVQEIRDLYKTGCYTHLELSGQFDIAPTTVGAIIRKINWK